MKKYLLGKKIEMTQVYLEDGKVVPVTIIDVAYNVVATHKTIERDGYEAVVLGKDKSKNHSKANEGQYKELGYVPQQIAEFPKEEDVAVGQKVELDESHIGKKVNVTGVSKGKGFQGVVKKFKFAGGPKTHGQSDRHRAPGSIGAGTTPGRVYKGKKMPGRLGGDTITVENLRVVSIDNENGLLVVKGAVPGARGTYLKIRISD